MTGAIHVNAFYEINLLGPCDEEPEEIECSYCEGTGHYVDDLYHYGPCPECLERGYCPKCGYAISVGRCIHCDYNAEDALALALNVWEAEHSPDPYDYPDDPTMWAGPIRF